MTNGFPLSTVFFSHSWIDDTEAYKYLAKTENIIS